MVLNIHTNILRLAALYNDACEAYNAQDIAEMMSRGPSGPPYAAAKAISWQRQELLAMSILHEAPSSMADAAILTATIGRFTDMAANGADLREAEVRAINNAIEELLAFLSRQVDDDVFQGELASNRDFCRRHAEARQLRSVPEKLESAAA